MLLVRLVDVERDRLLRKRGDERFLAIESCARASAASRRTRGCPRGAAGRARRPTLRRGRGPGEPWDESARLSLVAAEVVAPAAERLLLRGRHAGDEEHEIEDERVREEAELAPRRGNRDEGVREPGQRLEEVVRMARVAPEPASASSCPRFVGSALKRRSCSSATSSSAAATSQSAAPAHSTGREAVVAVEDCEHERQGEDRGDERLRLVEDREGRLLAAALAPAPAQLLVARVLVLARCGGRRARRCGGSRAPASTAIRTRCERSPGPRTAQSTAISDDARRPAGVDRGRVPRAALHQVEGGQQERGRTPADEPELPAVLDQPVDHRGFDLLGQRLRCGDARPRGRRRRSARRRRCERGARNGKCARPGHPDRNDRRAGDEGEPCRTAVPAALAALLRRALREDPEHIAASSSSAASLNAVRSPPPRSTGNVPSERSTAAIARLRKSSAFAMYRISRVVATARMKGSTIDSWFDARMQPPLRGRSRCRRPRPGSAAHERAEADPVEEGVGVHPGPCEQELDVAERASRNAASQNAR